MSELGVIEKTQAQAICDAVKEKEGSTEPIPFNVIADRITALKVGGGENKLAQYAEGTLTEITAEDLEGATKLREYALRNLTSLQKLGIPTSIKEFGDYSVENCPADVYYEGEPWKWCCIYRKNSFGANQHFKNIYSKGKLIEHLELSTKNAVELPDSPYYAKAVHIALKAFMNCESIKSLKISGVDERYRLQDYAFFNCINLTSVFIGNNQLGANATPSKSLPNNLFSGCTNLTDIYVCWAEGEISNAPWGATNATIHYNTPIPILIGGKEHSFLINMTWAEWCNSEYNTDGFYLDENSFVRTADGLYVKYYHNGADNYAKIEGMYPMKQPEYFILGE